jgi:hypothetical protein
MSELINELAAAGRQWSGDAPSGAMLSTMRAFMSAATKDDSLLREAADTLRSQDPGSAAWIAVALGTLVERGASAELSGPAILDHLRSWLPTLPTPGNDEAPLDPTREQATLLAQFQFVCQSAVTHLARLPAQREVMGHDLPLLERLDALGGYSHGALWVREALLKTSGTVVLLHPPSGTGLRLWYTNVSNNFHLFSLLQTAVGTAIPGGRPGDETLALAARGQSTAPVSDEAWWHYGSAASSKADVKATIWGEGLVRDIPRVNGEQVILLWPPILESRTWDAGFLGPHLEAMPADAGVERLLTADESKAWLEQLGVGPKRTRWWRFKDR